MQLDIKVGMLFYDFTHKRYEIHSQGLKINWNNAYDFIKDA